MGRAQPNVVISTHSILEAQKQRTVMKANVHRYLLGNIH